MVGRNKMIKLSDKQAELEIERKVEAHTKVSMDAYDKGLQEGAKLQKERILSLLKRRLEENKFRDSGADDYGQGADEGALREIEEIIDLIKHLEMKE